METQVDVKVVQRDTTHEKGIFKKGIFKKGAIITIDLEDMVAYHSGLTWNVVKHGDAFKLRGFNTFMEVV